MNDKKVLIVDFDTESLLALSNLVYEEGFQAETATDGLAAYEKFRTGKFDLVIMEPMLPKLHGFELCKRIASDPERRVPVVIVTAIYRDPSCRQDALNTKGAAAFFNKPYDRDELRSSILQLLVGRRERAARASEAAAVKTSTPAQTPASPAGPRAGRLELKDLLETRPVPKAAKPAKPGLDIEKELQNAVSDIVHPAKKKEAPVQREPNFVQLKDEFRLLREKNASRNDEDREIDVLLKSAIGRLPGQPKKKSPEAPIPVSPVPIDTETPRTTPPVKPVQPGKPAGWTGPTERIQVAEEIKEHLPYQPGKPNNIPRAAAPAEISSRAVPFDIDRTLIEIDKIPLEDIKPPVEDEKNEPRTFSGAKKKVLFEEFAEPARKKSHIALVGAVAAAVFLTAGAGFLILKPKKHAAGPPENAAVEQTQVAESVARPENSKPYPDAAEAELKPAPKVVAAKPAPAPPAPIGEPIDPTSSTEGAQVRIQEQPATTPAVPSDTPSESTLQAEPLSQPQAPAPRPVEPAVTAAETPSGQPVSEKTPEGALVALDKVDSPPLLTKKVEPKYPPLALRSGAQGTVTVNALISEKGDVLRTEILRGLKYGFGLEEAAENAVRQWKFRPAMKDGARVRVWKPVDITFKPNIKTS